MTERSAFEYTAFWLLLGMLIASLLSGCMVFQVQSVIPPAVITTTPTSAQTPQTLQQTPIPSSPPKTPTSTITATPTLMTTLMPSEGLIVFNLSGSDQEGIYLADVQVKNHRAVITGNEIYSNPVWSQDGKTIYFLSDLHSVGGILKVYSIGIDGSDLRRLTIDKFYDSNLALSPDGRRLAYISGHPNGDSIQRDIYALFTQNGAELPQLTNDPLYETALSWSPDGNMIAYMVQRAGTLKFGDLYVMAADGSDKLRLTKGLVLMDTPSWSPDGSKLVVAIERNGNQDLYLINVDGSGITRLTATDIREAHPVWSPNSQMIIYEAIDKNGVRNIFRINSYGGGELQLTDEQQHAEDVPYQPIWSPNGDHIAYVTQSSYGQADLYIMNVDGTGKTKLVGNLGQTIDGLDWVIPPPP